VHNFNEHNAAFDGFSPFYFQVIGPRLKAQEVVRKTAVRKTKWYLALTPLVVVVHVLVALFMVEWGAVGAEYEAIGIVGSALFTIPLYIAYVIIYSQRRIRMATKYSIIGGFCRFKNWTYFGDKLLTKPSHEIYGLSNFKRLGFVPNYNSATVEGHITGKIHETYFQFFRGTFSKAGETVYEYCPWKYRFRGQFISISFPNNFLGETIVLPDKGFLNSKKIRGLKRVRLVDPTFEKMFEVYGTDQVEARYLLAPDFMQRLVDLEHAFQGRSIRFGFVDNQLLIAIQTRINLGVGSMFKKLDDPARTQKILDALSAIYDVVDGVSKPQENILVHTNSTAA